MFASAVAATPLAVVILVVQRTRDEVVAGSCQRPRMEGDTEAKSWDELRHATTKEVLPPSRE